MHSAPTPLLFFPHRFSLEMQICPQFALFHHLRRNPKIEGGFDSFSPPQKQITFFLRIPSYGGLGIFAGGLFPLMRK